MTLFWNILTVTTLLASVITLVGFLGRVWWGFELTSHFRSQYFIILTISSCLFFFLGKWITGIGVTIFALINLQVLLPYYFQNPKKQISEKTYRVLLANVLKKNQSYDRVREIIRQYKPDFFVLIEVSEKWMEALNCLRSEYPFVKSAPRTDDYGLAVFSRVPMQASEILHFGDTDRPTIVTKFEMAANFITLVVPHPSPPKNKQDAELRNRQLLTIANFISERPRPCLLVGDLNITPWSPYFKDLLHTSGLQESRRGFGIQPTWPTTMPWFYIPIDHILVSPDIDIHHHQIGQKIGSDHRPVIVDFSIP